VERAKKNGWNWIITRPNIVVGTSKVGPRIYASSRVDNHVSACA
jgi:hypothetical protein